MCRIVTKKNTQFNERFSKLNYCVIILIILTSIIITIALGISTIKI